MNTGEKIKNMRNQKGLSQYTLAEKIGHLTQSQLSKIENGERRITDLDLMGISKALNVTIEDLVSTKELLNE